MADSFKRILTLLCLLFGLMVQTSLAIPSNKSEISDNDLPVLELGFPKEGQIREGTTENYRIYLKTGQFFRLIVGSSDLDSKVRLFGPLGDLLIERDSVRRRQTPEIVSWVVTTSGNHRVEVLSATSNTPSGSFHIKIEELRDATEVDRLRIAAELVEDDTLRLRARDTKDSLREAIEKQKTAAELWRKAGDLSEEAEALNAVGLLHRQLDEMSLAFDFYKKALELWRRAGDVQGEAMTLINLGKATEAFGDLKGAKESYEHALALMRSAGDQFGEGNVLEMIGGVYEDWGEMGKSFAYRQQALDLKRLILDRRGEASTLNSLATLYWRTGELGKAVDLLQEVLKLRRSLEDRRGEAATLNNLGVIEAELGELEEAAAHIESALSMHREWGDRASEAKALSSLGNVLRALGQTEKALECNEQALVLARELGQPEPEAVALHNIGNLSSSQKDSKKALASLDAALKLRRQSGNGTGEAATLNALGEAYFESGSLMNAEVHLHQALERWRAIRNPLQEANTLLVLARLEREQGTSSKALSSVESSLSILESLRTEISRQDLRTSFFSTKWPHYELYIQLAQDLDSSDPQKNYSASALHASERMRARSLLDILFQSGADIRKDADRELREYEESLQREVNFLERTRLRSPQKGQSAETVAIESKLDKLLKELGSIRAEIRVRSPRYAALTQPEPLKAEEIQALLGPGDLLLSYFLGEKRSFVWAATRSSLTAHEIPPREKIESAAKDLHDLLSKSDKRLARRPTEQAAARLAGMILSPVRKLLGKNRLILVADGALHYIPFAALPDPARPGQPLVVEHEIVNLPSASVLALLRKETGQRAPAPQEVAILADPVFRLNDPRVHPQTASLSEEPAAETGIVLRAAKDVGLDGFPRLRYTREEAEAIASLVKPEKVLKALDFEASKETATSGDLSRYRILHFATHGLLDTKRPELSGLVLSLVDRQGHSRDGFLRLHEIYNLDLPADLVVLSGCETALGKEVRGEGLMAITRGFMYAGTPAVVASLWQIDDRSTGELMKRFYRGMIQENLPAPAALRKAQVSLWKDKPTGSPYFWAGFVFQGDWRTVGHK